ncbi:hypothetical protein A4X17_03510 [Plantibacter sp. H53]|uniref:hypothetical protein n=1 Tax=Plantibacter sp. H53 TaxID=1827323 RepID=UPI0007DA01EB|nr:hypothetical protein [Plantibacter sp. H53]OAN33261.1 hypothetical protein A4X17_03510 [Plantibacter sp. H53]
MRSLTSRPSLVVVVIAAAVSLSGCVGQGSGVPGTAAPSATSASAVDLRAFAPFGTEGSGVSIRLQFPDGLRAGSVGTMDYLQNIVSPPVQCAPFEIELEEVGTSTLQIDGALSVVVRGEGGKTVAPAFVIPGDPVRAAFISPDVLTKSSLEDSNLTELEGFTLAALYPTSAADWERFSGRVLDMPEVELDQVC